MRLFATRSRVFTTRSSLFFDKKGECQHFRAFDHQSSLPDVLYIITTSLLDTFSTKSEKRSRNDSIESLSLRSNQKFLKKYFRPARKIAPDWAKMDRELSLKRFAWDDWTTSVIYHCLGTLNLDSKHQD